MVFFVLTLVSPSLWAFSEPSLAAKSDEAEPDVEVFLGRMHGLILESQVDRDIPTAVVLAQLCLETKFGTTDLATKANNYFGIKCGDNWNGEVYRHYDDCGDSTCHFRKYADPTESIRDYGLFLRKPRYAFLFGLSYHDYPGWAKGLKIAGYATDCRYAEKLIRLIERLQLTRFNRYKISGMALGQQIPQGIPLFVSARPGEKILDLGQRHGIDARELAEWNELPVSFVCNGACTIWLCPKSDHYRDCDIFFVVTAPTTLYEISQYYGVQSRVLLGMNPDIAHRDEVLPEGYRVVLRE